MYLFLSSNISSASIRSYILLLLLLSIVVALLWLDNLRERTEHYAKEQEKSPYLVCYYNFNETSLPEFMDFHLCSHINVGFAAIYEKNHSIYLSEFQLDLLKRILAKTTLNKNVQTLISVGGAGMPNFGPMTSNHANRKLFIRSLMNLIKEYKLDGVDLDWEWPVIDGGVKQKVQFIQLLYEIRTEFLRHKKKYLLTAAVAAVESIISSSYYVQHVAEYVDFVNVMCYDYHFYTKYYPVTDYNAPLYASKSDNGTIMAEFNVNHTLHIWLTLGMPADKIIIGLPSFGHTYRLMNGANHGWRAPANGYGFGDEGFATFSETSQFLHSSPFINVVRDSDTRVPYAYDFHNWLSYDDVQSLMEKTTFAKNSKIGGVMFYSLNSDDYSGNFSLNVKFPLLKAIHTTLYAN